MSILQRISYKRIIVHCSIFFLLTLIIISPELVFSLRESSIKEILVNFVLIELFLLIPFIFFYKNLTIYYFLIAIYCSLTPILFLPVILINEKISPEIIIAALNSNFQEINELLGWKLLLLFALMIVFFSGAFYLTKFLPKKTTFKTGLRASME